MIINGTNLSMIRGDSESFTIRISHKNGDSYQFKDGDVVYFTIKTYSTSDKKLFQRKITFFEDNNIIVEFEPKDTKHFRFDKYVYDVQLTTSLGRVITIIPPSEFRILEEVTYD